MNIKYVILFSIYSFITGGGDELVMLVNTILLGNNIETLKSIPDQYVHCCVTSPPYYGLRDYGTAQWEGGDPNCDHRKLGDNKVFGNPEFNENRPSREQVRTVGYRNICEKCGALRIDDQIGLEETPDKYIEKLVSVFREVYRILRDDGTLWVNIGDSYAGSGKGGATHPENAQKYKQGTNKGLIGKINTTVSWGDAKPKDLIGIPWMLAFALRADGWYLRQDIIWSKPNPMPESVTDRCTKSHEYIFLLSKSKNYYFNNDAIKEPCSEANVEDYVHRKTLNNKSNGKGTYEEVRPDLCRSRDNYMPDDFMRNKRDVWTITTKPYRAAHFATFPEELVVFCILAGCKEDGIVLDPFLGSGTTAAVAVKLLRKYIGCELNPDYKEIAEKRISEEKGLFNQEVIS